MSKRIIHWFTYNVALGLLPFFASVLLRHFAGVPVEQSFMRSPELLFFSLLLCSVTLGDLSNLKGQRSSLLLSLLYSSTLLGAIFSAVLYGSFLQDNIVNGSGSPFQSRVLTISIWMALIFFALTTITQIAIARKETHK